MGKDVAPATRWMPATSESVSLSREDHASFKNSVSLLNDMAVIDFLPFDLVSIEFSAGVLQGFVKGGKRR